MMTTTYTRFLIIKFPPGKLLVVIFLLCMLANLYSQNPTLELEGDGLLLSRLTTIERDALVSPPKGLMIYNLTTDCVEIYQGSGWYNLCNGGAFVSQPVNKLLGDREDDAARQVKKTIDGGYVLAGYGVSPLGDLDFCVIKLDAAGTVLWSHYYGGSDVDSAFTIDLTSDGGYIVAGSSRSSISRDVTETNHGLLDYWLLKLDPLGNISWNRLLGGSGNDMARSVVHTADGGYLVAGVSFSSSSGDVTQANQGNGDFWVVKLDGAGNIIWDRLVGKNLNEEASSIRQTLDGGYIIAGSTRSQWSDSGMMLDPSGSNYLVVKMDPSGQTNWTSAIGSENNDFARSIIQALDGSYLVAGYHDDFTEPAILPVESYTGYVLRLNPDGTQDASWILEFDGDGEDIFNDIVQTSEGGFILAGSSTSSANGDITPVNHGMHDSWIRKLNASGSILWQRLFGADGIEKAYSLCQTSDGGYIVAGLTNSSENGEVLPVSNGAFDYWVVKLNSFGEIQE